MSDVPTYINALLWDARCFRCLSDKTQLEVQTYILATVYEELGVDPNELAQIAKCIGCLTRRNLLELQAYLLTYLNGTYRFPNGMIDNARCFDCIPTGMQRDAQTYLFTQDPDWNGISEPNRVAEMAKSFQTLDVETLLQIQVYILALFAEIEPDPNVLMEYAVCMRCVPDPLLAAIATQALEYMMPVPATSPRATLDPPPVDEPRDPPTPPGGCGRGGCGGGGGNGRGGGVAGCSDTMAQLTPVLSNVTYTAGVLSTFDISIPRTCCKNGRYEVWGSNDPALAGPTLLNWAATPNRTGHYEVFGEDVSTFGFDYYAVRMNCDDGDIIGPWSNIVGINPIARDWGGRVVTNGGADPSGNTLETLSEFVNDLQAGGIYAKMIALNPVVPDNITAACTPLIVGPGNDPWTNVAGKDLTIDGLQANAANSYLATGVIPSAAFASVNSGGLTVYITESGRDGAYAMGSLDTANFRACYIRPSNGFVATAAYPNSTDSQISYTAPTYMIGYVSLNRTDSTHAALYNASPVFPHAAVATDAGFTAVTNSTYGIYAMATNNAGAVLGSSLYYRYSFFAIHHGLTSAESEILYNAVQKMRVGLHGGYLDDPTLTGAETVERWVNRVVDYGGAEPSALVQNALETFWDALVTAGINTEMVSVLPLIPGDLVTARCPIFRSAGRLIWANENFVIGDLTVNGLTGNGVNKLLRTGVRVGHLPLTNRGRTVYCHTSVIENKYDFGSFGTDNFLLGVNYGNNSIYDDPYNGGAERISVLNPDWEGYLSGNVLAANNRKLFSANSTTPHSQIGTDADAPADNRDAVHAEAGAFAVINTVGYTGSLYCSRTLSFLAMHKGLDITESESFFNAIQALRVALGGGYI